MTNRDKLIEALNVAIASIESQIEQLETQRDAVDNLKSNPGRTSHFAQRVAAALMRLA